MTNGEKLKAIFPNITERFTNIDEYTNKPTRVEISVGMHILTTISVDVWNAEYKKPTTKSDLGVDCISRARAIERLKLNFPISEGADNSRDRHRYMQALADLQAIKELPSVTPQEPRCKWIKYDYRTMCPKEHDIDNPYWRIPENRMKALKYCPYCGKEIEVEE